MKRFTFQTKVLIGTLAVFFALISVLTLYFSNYVKGEAVRQVRQNLDVLSAKTAQQLDTVIYNMDKTALQLAANPYIIDVFNSLPKEYPGNYFTDELPLAREVSKFVSSFNFKQNMSARICLYNSGGDFTFSGVRPVSVAAVEQYFSGESFDRLQAYFEDDENKFSYFISPREDPFSIARDRVDHQEIFSIVREIKNYSILDATHGLGYVEVQHPMIRISELFTLMDSSVAGLVLDESNRILYARLPEGQQNALPELMAAVQEAGEVSGSFESGNYFLSSASLEQLKLRVAVLQNRDDALAMLSSSWSLIILFFLLILAFTCMAEYLIIRHLTRPLKRLRKAVDAISLDNLSMELSPEESNDELQRLSRAFNLMFKKLEESIDEMILAKTGELKSYVQSLQAQMNPHFMHNILTVISLSVSEGRTEIIPLICEKLASMLRYTASYQDIGCTLRDELAYTQDYLTLMKIRYEDRFSYETEIDPELLDIPVPKLILQPLAENCFQHGFRDRRPPWSIRITACREGDKWLVAVHDNGSGFKPEELQRFERFTKEMDVGNVRSKLSELQIGGLCLANIYIRMKLLYSREMIFTIQNREGEGTTVVLGGLLDDSSFGSGG